MHLKYWTIVLLFKALYDFRAHAFDIYLAPATRRSIRLHRNQFKQTVEPSLYFLFIIVGVRLSEPVVLLAGTIQHIHSCKFSLLCQCKHIQGRGSLWNRWFFVRRYVDVLILQGQLPAIANCG